MLDSGPSDWLVFSLLFRLDGVVNGIRRNGNVLILPTPFPSIYDSAYDSDFRFSDINALMTPIPTPSLVKTSLEGLMIIF